MVVVILEWIYIGILSFLIGFGTWRLLRKIWSELSSLSVLAAIILGMTVITIYAEAYSIFGKVGVLAHLLMVLVAGAAGLCNRREIWEYFRAKYSRISLWEAAFY